MRTLILLLPVVLVVVCVIVVRADTILVPSQQPTIQAGIDAAVDGDTVLVADGTYTGDGNRDIDFLGKAIVVMSENGAPATIIDCAGDSLAPHRAFYFHSGEDTGSIVQGFTIQNVDMPGIDILTSAGAILCDASSPLIRNNIFTDNMVDMEAGYWSRGGAIGCQSESQAVIEGNTFSGNSAFYGGAINAWSASPLITGNTFTENTGHGAAIYTVIGSPTIRNNTIMYNTALPLFLGAGGGILCTGTPSLLIEGNTISKNSAIIGGGILVVYDSSVTILNNIITENTGFGGCGGIYVAGQCEVEVLNTILWSNYAPNPPMGKEISIRSYSTVTISYSDVDGGQASIEIEDNCVLNWGEGMIDADAVFVLPEKQDYRLLWGSPCIDSGHPDSLDADGTRSDMGAHYFNQNDYLTLYITPDLTEVPPGGELGVTYTAINRWNWSQPFWALSAVKPAGGTLDIIMGPDKYKLPPNYTAQVYTVYNVPPDAPQGMYEYLSAIGMPPATLYDWDSFKYRVKE